MNGLLLESATRLAQRIRDREVTSEEVVRVHIERAKRTHGKLNAIVMDRYDDAMKEALAADARVRKGGKDLPPLWGVPCSIKECYALTGMPQTSGLVSRRDFRAKEDAPAVARLRAAGAIPIGVTNTSELCMWMESSNKLYGRSNNPYDTRRTTGGSSGGEGAVVGTGAVPFGLGSDIGGSIRMPAFFCGVFGHKPTPGVIPTAGQFPIAHGTPARMLTSGPLSRRAEDLWPWVSILADPGKLRGTPSDVSFRDLVVLDVPDNGRLRVSKALRTAQVRTADALAKRGGKVRKFHSDTFAQSIEIWSAMMAESEGPTFGEMLGAGTAIKPVRELAKWAVGKSAHTFPAIGLAIVERFDTLRGPSAKRIASLARTLRHEIEDALGESGVLLFPSYTRVAPRHHTPIALPIQWMYTAIFNALELPVTQVPLGLDERGLPLGVQVVGAQYRDAITIAVARALEEDLGGWVPPTP